MEIKIVDVVMAKLSYTAIQANTLIGIMVKNIRDGANANEELSKNGIEPTDGNVEALLEEV